MAFATAREQVADNYLAHKPGIGRTPFAKAGEGWKQVSDEFLSFEQGGAVAIGFLCIGHGKAYFDDFRLEEIGGPTIHPTTRPATLPAK